MIVSAHTHIDLRLGGLALLALLEGPARRRASA